MATAKLLIEYGAEVVINGRDRTKLDSVKKELGAQASISAFDAANPEDRTRALAEVGKFDHLVGSISGWKLEAPFTRDEKADIRSGF